MGDSSSIPGSGRSPGEGHGNAFQYSCLENPKDRGAWRSTSWDRKKSDKTEATDHTCMHTYFDNFFKSFFGKVDLEGVVVKEGLKKAENTDLEKHV